MKRITRILGGLIALHGLARIVFLTTYVDFVQQNFSHLVSNSTWLTYGAVAAPFTEFFVGMLITLQIRLKYTLIAGLFISYIMSVFLVTEGMYERMVYHVIVMAALSYTFINCPEDCNRAFMLK
ncbi:hypothetical protein MG296_08535 [Flavobacteriaceae bacterium TK19130]|nr:hypothetical protein [Thermobacterium salinum]